MRSRPAEAPTKWTDFLDMPDTLKGHVGMLTDTVETLLPALYSQSQSPITDDQAALKNAYLAMLSVNPNILTY